MSPAGRTRRYYCYALAQTPVKTRSSTCFKAKGYDAVNYDILNGQVYDLADTAISNEMIRSVAAGDYLACFASPDCSTFSKLLNLPGGPPVLRGNSGRARYGLKKYSNGRPLSADDKEKVRVHTLVAVRVAQTLDLFHGEPRRIPRSSRQAER